MNNAEILVIDDELQICKLLEITLQSNDYKVSLAYNGKEGIIMAANHPPDLILLDIGLPDMSGHEVLRKIREWYYKPIIILSVQDDEANIIQALDNGANDYLSKPFRTGELLARIRTALRSSTVLNDETAIVSCGTLVIDFASRVIRKDNEIIKLTSTEYRLLHELAIHRNQVMLHEQLLTSIWGEEYRGDLEYLRTYIRHLRSKLEVDPTHPKLIVRSRGVGYMFVCPDAAVMQSPETDQRIPIS